RIAATYATAATCCANFGMRVEAGTKRETDSQPRNRLKIRSTNNHTKNRPNAKHQITSANQSRPRDGSSVTGGRGSAGAVTTGFSAASGFCGCTWVEWRWDGLAMKEGPFVSRGTSGFSHPGR